MFHGRDRDGFSAAVEDAVADETRADADARFVVGGGGYIERDCGVFGADQFVFTKIGAFDSNVAGCVGLSRYDQEIHGISGPVALLVGDDLDAGVGTAFFAPAA